MREDIAELVHAVFRGGFRLKERLAAGEPVDLKEGRRDLLRLLDNPLLHAGDRYDLGVHYALVCWLDELLIDDTPAGQQWSEEFCLEQELYQTRLRAHKFWNPGVKAAEARPGGDVLEVYYLCYLLGFRGDEDSRPADLAAWAERVRPQVMRGYGEEPAQLDKSTPDSDVPYLFGRSQFRKMLQTWAVALLILAFVVGFLVVYRFGSRVSAHAAAWAEHAARLHCAPERSWASCVGSGTASGN